MKKKVILIILGVALVLVASYAIATPSSSAMGGPQVGGGFGAFLLARVEGFIQQIGGLFSGSGRHGNNPPPAPTPATPAPSVTIVPSTLPGGTVGTTYSQTLTASTTATGTFAWSISSGSFPAGLTLSAAASTNAASIYGTPTKSGTFNAKIMATNGTSSSTQSYSIVIAPKPAPAVPPAPTSTLTVAVLVSGGTSTAANFNLFVNDGTSTAYNGIASATKNFAIKQGDSYGVTETTSTNSLNYTIAPGSVCFGTMPAAAVTCSITDTYVAPVVPTSTTSTSTTPTSTTPTSTASATTTLQWGAYVGDGTNSLSSFESLVGAPVNIVADFEDWSAGSFPSYYQSNVGAAGKTLLIFWEPQYSYDTINNGSEDAIITQFSAAAKTYGYPVILAPFDEMNINENAWGAYQGTNTPAKFVQAWQHVHSFFTGDTNVKFAWDVNNVSVPDTASNSIASYYPGSAYVDYVGMDGFNFGNPTQSFDQVFDPGIAQIETYGKPIYIFSTASMEYSGKGTWITEGLGTHIKTYANIAGWIWFNQNDAAISGSGDTINWTVNSDSSSLAAFKSIIP